MAPSTPHFAMLRQSNKLGRNRVWPLLSIPLNFIGERYKILPTVDLNRSHESFTETAESFKINPRCALLGVSLVLKRYSMTGDGLSHVGFGALSVAMAMNLAPLEISIPVVVLSAFFLLRI